MRNLRKIVGWIQMIEFALVVWLYPDLFKLMPNASDRIGFAFLHIVLLISALLHLGDLKPGNRDNEPKMD